MAFKLNEIHNTQNNSHIIKLNSNNDTIEVKLRPSIRCKNIKIRVSAFKGVELVLPKAANYNKAHQFLLSNEEWVIKQFNQIRKPALLTQEIIPIFGKVYNLSFRNNISEPVTLEEDKIILLEKYKDNANLIIESFLRIMIRNEITQYAETVSKVLGVKYNKIQIKDTITRWGSCSITRNLMFSWRLIFAPKFVMEYVVAHELCHILEMNHSEKFWNWVKQASPNYELASSWLKKHGQSLHCYLRKIK